MIGNILLWVSVGLVVLVGLFGGFCLCVVLLIAAVDDDPDSRD
jgi:hypothetical protein